MRFGCPSITRLSLMAALLAGCAAPSALPLASPEVAQTTLWVRPYVLDGGLGLQAKAKTAADIATLEVIPKVHVGNDVFWPLSPLTGEATDSEDPAQILMARHEGFDPDTALRIPLTGLRRQTRYRLEAKAYDAEGNLISKGGEPSSAEFEVKDDPRPALNVALPVALIDVPFEASWILRFDVSGSFFVLNATLYEVDPETDQMTPVQGATFTLTPQDLDRTVTIRNLKPRTTYRLAVSLLDEAFLVLGGKSVDLELRDDDAPVQETVEVTVTPPN